MTKADVTGAVMLFLLGVLLGVVVYNTTTAADQAIDAVDGFAQVYVVPTLR